MTISSTTRLAGPYTGTGTTGPFTFAFKVFQASDLYLVKLEISTGTETVLTLTTDYTVALNGNQDSNPGGSITLVAALTSAYTLTVTSDIANLQPTDITNQSGFYPEVITDALDRATIQIQQISNIGDRTLKIPVSDGLSLNMELPTATDRANGYLAFTGTGEPSVIAIPTGGLSSLTLTATTASTSNTTGALIVYGGAGIAKDCYINSMFVGTKGLTNSTAIGVNAMLLATGINSTAFGNGAMASNSGTLCTGIGIGALTSNTAANCIAVGNNALYNNTGVSSTAVGVSALFTNTGTSNTAIGYQSGYQNAGNSITAVGYNALYQNTQSSCTAVGVDALNLNTIAGATGMGSGAGKTNSGSALCAFGYQAAFSNAGGTVTAVGYQAAYQNTGNGVTAVGYRAAFNCQAASNTVVGYNSLSWSAGNTGVANICVGDEVLPSNTSGTQNVGVGFRALYLNTTGGANTCIGHQSGDTLTVGTQNVVIGATADVSTNNAINSIVIGHGAVGIGDNTTVIGKTATLATKIFGVQATGQTAPTIASAATIAPTTSIVYVSGTTPIVTITPPTGIATTGGQITLIPTGAFTTTTAGAVGGIALASTAVVSKAMIMTYCAGTSKWYPSY